MVRYRRNVAAGGTFFFMVTLADRQSSVLVRHVAALRTAFRVARNERPFSIDAVVILPDHLYAIMTLPPMQVSAAPATPDVASLIRATNGAPRYSASTRLPENVISTRVPASLALLIENAARFASASALVSGNPSPVPPEP